MFKIGDLVLYGAQGVCLLLDIEMRKVGKKTQEYYVLEPVEQTGARYYIPTQNQAALAKLRPIITQDELCTLLNSGQISDDAWASDENQRKQLYKNLITSGDWIALLQMVHSLYRQKDTLNKQGKKLHLCDENFLRDAERMLDVEFSLALNIPREEVSDFILQSINKD